MAVTMNRKSDKKNLIHYVKKYVWTRKKITIYINIINQIIIRRSYLLYNNGKHVDDNIIYNISVIKIEMSGSRYEIVVRKLNNNE